jgi:hypothetical protein
MRFFVHLCNGLEMRKLNNNNMGRAVIATLEILHNIFSKCEGKVKFQAVTCICPNSETAAISQF